MSDAKRVHLPAALTRAEDAGHGDPRVWVAYPEGPSLGYQRLLNSAAKKDLPSGPLAELNHALLCGSHERVLEPQHCVDAPYPGYLLFQDTYFVGDVQGLGDVKSPGKLYLQSVIDAHCSLAFAKLYPSRAPINAVDVLDEMVLPFYEQQGLKVERVFTDNGKEYGGLTMTHPFDTYLALCGIEHLRCGSLPAAADNPFCAQFHQLLDEDFFAPALRKNFHLHLETMQQDLDVYLKHYNCERKCPGIRTQGRAPFQAFLDSIVHERGRLAGTVRART